MNSPEFSIPSNGLLSKWGFNDGDMLDDLLMEHDLDKVDDHKLLTELVLKYVLPKLDQKVEVEIIGTAHNPIRARTVDGVDVASDWFNPTRAECLTPEFVGIPIATILELARELSKT